MRIIYLVLFSASLMIFSCNKENQLNIFEGVSGKDYSEVLLTSGHPPVMSGFINSNNEFVTFTIPTYSDYSFTNRIVDGEILIFNTNGLVSRESISFDAFGAGRATSGDINGQTCFWPSNMKASIAQYTSGMAISENHSYGPQDITSLTQIGNEYFYDIMALTKGPNNSLFILVSSNILDTVTKMQHIDPKIYHLDASGTITFYASIDLATAMFSGGGGIHTFDRVTWYHNHNTMDMIADNNGNLWIVSPYVDFVVKVNSNGTCSRGVAISNPVSITEKGGYLYVLTSQMYDPNDYSVRKHPELWEITPEGIKTIIHTFANLDYKFDKSKQSTPSEGGLLMPYDANFNISIDKSNNFYLSSPVSGEVILLK